MPEKGWEIITVKTETKRSLMRVSRSKGMSINDLIISFLKKRGDKSEKISSRRHPKVF